MQVNKTNTITYAALLLGAASKATAATGIDLTKFSDGGNNVISQFGGPLGVTLIALALVFMGVMLVFRKLTLTWVALIIGGAFLIFGASDIAKEFQSWFKKS